jgi:hypothetical protein
MFTGPQRPELIRTERWRRLPVIIAGEIDVFPAQGRQMGKITGFRTVPLPSKVIDGPLQVRRIP